MPDFATRVLSAPNGRPVLFSVGQAGYIIKSSSGQLLAWDLYLSCCGERLEQSIGFKRLLPEILSPRDLVFDTVIASHPHFDHFDPDSMPGLMADRRTKLFASAECRALSEKYMLDDSRITYVRPGETYHTGDFSVAFVNCDHGTGAPDAVGAVISVDGLKFYFAGDTCLRLDRTEEILSQGPIDVMIAPINGAYGNLDEHDCALLSKALCPRLTIPCHYGMFARHGGNPWLFMQHMLTECPENKYVLMCMGEELPL